MTIEHAIELMQLSDNFEVLPPTGVPQLKGGHILPSGMSILYTLCGGIRCYTQRGGFPLRILSPSEILPSNLQLLHEEFPEDITDSWYLIVDALDSNFISIDCDRSRLERCYESFVYTHGIRGDCPIIADSIASMLKSIIEYNGDYFYWKSDDFVSLGDAYKDDNSPST